MNGSVFLYNLSHIIILYINLVIDGFSRTTCTNVLITSRKTFMTLFAMTVYSKASYYIV